MKIVISGGTEAGLLFANTLSAKNDLHVIESDSNALKELAQLDLQVVEGNPTSLNTLKEAQIGEADAFIACARSDELNVLSCLAVKQISKAKTFCFVNRSHYFETFAGELGERLVIDRIIWPEKLLAEHIYQIITVPGAIDVKLFDREDLKVFEFRVKEGSSIINQKLKDLQIPVGALAVAVFRDAEIIIPNGLTSLEEGDKILFMGHASSMNKVESRFSPKKKGKLFNIVIVGGGSVGSILAKYLEENLNVKLRIIDSSREQCEQLAESLNDRILILNADGTDGKLLKEQQVKNCDCLVALTGNDERNLFAGLHAKMLNAKKVITRAHNVNNIDFFENQGIDVALSSQLIAVQHVSRQILDESLDVFAFFEQGKAEIREIDVPTSFKPTPLMQLKLPKGAIIAAIRRGGRTIVPCGADKIMGKDRLRVFCAQNKGEEIAEFLQKTAETAKNKE